MAHSITQADCFALVRPAVDAHTLGLSSVEQLLHDCGLRTLMADAAVCEAFSRPTEPACAARIDQWIRRHRVTVLGLSYRLRPVEGADLIVAAIHSLKARRLLAGQGGPIRAIHFAGLPETCALVRQRCPEVAGVFDGDETPAETLQSLGIRPEAIPRELAEEAAYDQARMAFGRELIGKGGHMGVRPADRGGYEDFGTDADTVIARLKDGARRGRGPLYRAHVGPYLPDRDEAVRQFLEWTGRLASAGFLDVLSIGTSQLTQSDFGQDWGDRPNGGGVPLNSPEEFAAVWRRARPMLVRTYAGTRNVPELARMYEQTIHIAWHALSLWWFCQIDGRGPNTVRQNLLEHVRTLGYIAATGKPFEPNLPHHFAFRGADDVTYVVSAVLAARAAKAAGVRWLILQNMLNTPRPTWGVQDLAKSRACLALVRELEDSRFGVILQPRGGLDYFSTDLDKARAQLAAVAALMDDIEPHDPSSPPIIHVVSYSEASHLADPDVVNESIQITAHALAEYRRLRSAGQIADMADHPEVRARTGELLAEARTVLGAIESAVPQPHSPDGLYRIFADGYLPVPYLWEGRDEFRRAVSWKTRLIRGSVKVVDAQGRPIPVADRMRQLALGLAEAR